jgi:hypothetical protein
MMKRVRLTPAGQRLDECPAHHGSKNSLKASHATTFIEANAIRILSGLGTE